MKQVLLAVLILIGFGLRNAEAQEGGIEATISAQIEAFKADDFDAAFGFASSGIQSKFGTSEAFERMVRQGYGVMTDPAEMRFLDRREESGLIWQRVLYRDAAGTAFLFDYQMIETPDGWRVGAVYPVKMPEQLT